jgi:hypothetical protein
VGGTFDLRYRSWKIEVKSSAYLQSWHQNVLSNIRFDVAEHEGWDPDTNIVSMERMRPADCYVFCLYAEKDRSRVNVLDTSMWEFYVLATGQINCELKAQKSAGLNRIKSMTEPVGYGQLRKRVDRVVCGAD